MNDIQEDIKLLSQIILQGKVIICPTDTIWGLSCNALDFSAVQKIYAIKKRDLNKPLILLVKDLEQLKRYAKNIHPRIENLLHFYSKPLTVIHQASELLPDYLSNENGEIAIRICEHPLIQELLSIAKVPIVSTSANLQSAPTPKIPSEIEDIIKVQVDHICSANENKDGQQQAASTIISYNEEGELFFLR